MSGNLTITGLRAAALTGLTADAATRTITGRLAVYGTAGTTSAGRTVFEPASITPPDDVAHVALLVEHDRERPVGYATAIGSSADAALWASFHLPPGPLADAALADAAAGVRNGLSVGLDLTASHRDAAGVLHVTAAALREGSLVSVPAFTDTRVTEIAASAPEPPQLPDPDTDPAPDPDPDPAPQVRASAPAGLPARTAPRGPQTMSDVYAMLTASHTGRGEASLTAALADITHTANAWVQPQQYAGELWDHVAYTRRVVPLVTNRPLTSYKVTGWRWKVAPEVDTWAGDKTAVPSNAAVTEAVEVAAERLAGAHDVDRKYRDFGDTGFFESYYSAMTESYARKSDAALLADLIAGATGYAADAGEAIWESVVGAALEVGKVSPTTFVVVGSRVLKELVGISTNAAPAWLGLLPDNPFGSIATSPDMPPDDVLVGARDAATFYELPSSPIRVEAVDMTKGGIDPGVFGYYATIVNQSAALQHFSAPPAADPARSARKA